MSLIAKALKDEKLAPGQYKRLLRTLKSKKEKKIVRGIIKDEQRHYKKLKSFK